MHCSVSLNFSMLESLRQSGWFVEGKYHCTQFNIDAILVKCRSQYHNTGKYHHTQPTVSQPGMSNIIARVSFLVFLHYLANINDIIIHFILLFRMCCGIRILSPFLPATQFISIKNLNCPKNAESHAQT